MIIDARHIVGRHIDVVKRGRTLRDVLAIDTERRVARVLVRDSQGVFVATEDGRAMMVETRYDRLRWRPGTPEFVRKQAPEGAVEG